VTIDAMATNPTLAAAIRAAAANSLLAVKANQPTLRAEIAAFFAAADPTGPDGEREPFCRLRTDYSDRVPATILGG
jgi:hypothetical protein